MQKKSMDVKKSCSCKPDVVRKYRGSNPLPPPPSYQFSNGPSNGQPRSFMYAEIRLIVIYRNGYNPFQSPLKFKYLHHICFRLN